MYLTGIFLSLLGLCHGANILAIIPTPSFSHQTAFWPLWKQLSLKGHNVTVVTTDPMNDPKLTNLTEINLHSAYELMDPVYQRMGTMDPLTTLKFFNQQMRLVMLHILDQESVKELMKKDKRFDVVLVESLFPLFLAFGEKHRCTTILVSSLDALNYIHSYMGNLDHPVASQNMLLPFYKDHTYKERLISTFFYVYGWYHKHFDYFPQMNKDIAKSFGEGMITLQDMLNKVQMLFLNVHPALNSPRLMGPSTIMFGGMVHLREPKPLPQDLQTFLDKGKEGVIYLSFGTNMKADRIHPEKKQILFKVLNSLPYKVLWKYEGQDFQEHPNIKYIKWSPQQDVLRHPNVKLFITQGGLQSLEEAIYNGVPVVVLPFFGDQMSNGRKIEDRGIGKTVNHMESGLDENILRSTILEVLHNDSYRQNAEALRDIILDEPMPGVDKAVWWTEYVIRNKGAQYLRMHSKDVPWYQYLMLDIFAFLTAVAVAVMTILYLAWRLLKLLVRLAFRKSKVD
ncbi:unnamed protein product [Acanthoscelides obtectus]|uniref:UDP-glucuronosyltransferase n=1 Tax=Acanthoscelides obtectus TaxID=200917 RepID=A0A9P0K923_ACAOB|nr:unnamed protein product [Acanthoscelides obtectus]CAK1683151.1 Ecdysteroid UDP-glucosyltransferase [Acanthoscelides obtectus]